MNHAAVVLQVAGPHVGLGAERAAVGFDPRVDDLVRAQPRAAGKSFAAGGTQPRLWRAAAVGPGGGAVWVQVGQVVAQVVTAVEAQRAQRAGKRLLARVDEGVTGQTGAALQNLAAHVAAHAAAAASGI